LFTGDGVAVAQEKEALSGSFGDNNPRSNFWRAVRGGGEAGTSQVKGIDSGMLINNGGENWRQMRNGPIFYWGAIGLGVVLGLIFLFHLLVMGNGMTNLEGGRSGIKVKRWGIFTRLLHWVTAMLLLLRLLPFNFPNKADFKWLASFGGMFSKNSHAPAGRMNAGEKIWFWLLVFVGGAVIASGVVMLFGAEIFGSGLNRADSQTAMIVHGIASLIILAVALGHIYIGTAGTEGSFEGMASGKVDLNWARQHHNLWVEDLQRKGKLDA